MKKNRISFFFSCDFNPVGNFHLVHTLISPVLTFRIRSIVIVKYYVFLMTFLTTGCNK